MSRVKTLKEGLTPDDRVILTVADTGAPSPDPTLPGDGLDLFGVSFLHVYAELTGSVTAADITPWYFSRIGQQWFEGNQLAFNATTLIALIQTEGEEQVSFVVDSITGVGTIKIWAGGSWSMIQTSGKGSRG